MSALLPERGVGRPPVRIRPLPLNVDRPSVSLFYEAHGRSASACRRAGGPRGFGSDGALVCADDQQSVKAGSYGLVDCAHSAGDRGGARNGTPLRSASSIRSGYGPGADDPASDEDGSEPALVRLNRRRVRGEFGARCSRVRRPAPRALAVVTRDCVAGAHRMAVRPPRLLAPWLRSGRRARCVGVRSRVGRCRSDVGTASP